MGHNIGVAYMIYTPNRLTNDMYKRMTSMMWDITREIDKRKKNSIQTPDTYSTIYSKLYDKEKDEPFFHVRKDGIYGFCTDTDILSVNVIKEIINIYKKRYNIKLPFKFTYESFDSYWIVYDKGLVYFGDCITKMQSINIGQKKRCFTIK